MIGDIIFAFRREAFGKVKFNGSYTEIRRERGDAEIEWGVELEGINGFNPLEIVEKAREKTKPYRGRYDVRMDGSKVKFSTRGREEEISGDIEEILGMDYVKNAKRVRYEN